jgi:hypothetical protein
LFRWNRSLRAEGLSIFGALTFGATVIKTPVLTILLVLVLGKHNAVLADDNDHHRDKNRWWGGEWKEEFWDGPCEVKVESKRGEFEREIKCKDGVGARWRGDWKKEFQDGPCKVKQEAKRDEFKEEVKCE